MHFGAFQRIQNGSSWSANVSDEFEFFYQISQVLRGQCTLQPGHLLSADGKCLGVCIQITQSAHWCLSTFSLFWIQQEKVRKKKKKLQVWKLRCAHFRAPNSSFRSLKQLELEFYSESSICSVTNCLKQTEAVDLQKQKPGQVARFCRKSLLGK